MNLKGKIKILSILLAIIMIFSGIGVFATESNNIEKIEEKLFDISEEEKIILEELFIYVQELENLEKENIRIGEEIDNIEDDILLIEEKITNEEIKYKKSLENLEKILKSYQKMGSSSFINIILNSDSISDFIKRVNVVRDLSKNSSNLLKGIEESKLILLKDKEGLDLKLENLEVIKINLAESLEKQEKLVGEKESYLTSLADDRYIYEKRLEYISLIMNELKTIFAEVTKTFSHVIESGAFPADAVKLNLSLGGVKGVIEEAVFNELLSQQESLPAMDFSFIKDKVQISIPDKNLFITGKFILIADQVLKFESESGSFYDMALEKETIDNLFEEQGFVIDLGPLIGKNIIKSIDIYDGYIEMSVTIKLF